MKKYIITAIDTDAGKTVATGVLAKTFANLGIKVITCKLAQTGCEGISIDIQEHRRLMSIGLQPYDLDGTTCPFIFPFPASPHLSAKLTNQTIDLEVIDKNITQLASQCDMLLIEGVGGIMVPILPDYLVVDFIADRQLPVILVTSARLGSINHTLLTLEVCHQRNIEVAAIIFNHYPASPEVIANDTSQYIKSFAKNHFPNICWMELPSSQNTDNLIITSNIQSLL